MPVRRGVAWGRGGEGVRVELPRAETAARADRQTRPPFVPSSSIAESTRTRLALHCACHLGTEFPLAQTNTAVAAL